MFPLTPQGAFLGQLRGASGGGGCRAQVEPPEEAMCVFSPPGEARPAGRAGKLFPLLVWSWDQQRLLTWGRTGNL